jgi:hypothetical protein
MSDREALLEDVLNHRTLAELRLKRLLRQAQINEPLDDEVDMIEFLVLSYHHTRLNLFFAHMRCIFASAPQAVDKDALVLVMNDLWHYFPHRSLDGKSPAEIFDEGKTLGRWKTKPVRRARPSE